MTSADTVPGAAVQQVQPSRRQQVTALLATLFRSETQPPPALWWLLLPVLAALGAGLSLLRVGGAANSTLWAEDGLLFFQDQHDTGYLHNLLHGYDGYLHLVPRTIVWVASAAPLSEWALSVSVTCAVVTGLVATFIGRALPAYGVPRPVAAALGLLLPLASVAIYECSDVAANIQWFLAAGVFWALLWAPRERRWITAGAVLAFLTAGSAPLTLTLVPLALIRLAVTRGRAQIVPVAYLLGAALQVYTMQHSTREGIVKPDSLGDLIKTTSLRLYTMAFFGKGWTASGIAAVGSVMIVAAALVWVLLAVSARRSPSSLVLLGCAFVCAGLLFGAGTYFNFVPIYFLPGNATAGLVTTGRYANSPSVIIMTAAAAALFAAGRASRLTRPVLGALLALSVAVVVHDFHYYAPRQSGPQWASALRSAASTCHHTGEDAVRVGVAPLAGFDILLPCREVLAVR